MKLIYKIAIPAFSALILIILLVAFWQKRFIGEALSQEEFLRINETAARITLEYLKADNFLEPFSPSSQKQLKDFSEELQRPSIARLTIWNRDQVIAFSDLKSVIGFHSPDHRDLKRVFAEEKPFFIVKTEETNKPVQSEIGEFLDIYIPIRISGKVVGALEIHAAIAAILRPIEKHISVMSYVLITSSGLILIVVLVAVFRGIAEHRRAEEALRESEMRFRSVTQSANDGIIVANSNGNIILWNKGAQTIFGYAEEEVLHKPLTTLIPERYRDAHRTGLERFRSTGESNVIGKTVELHGLRKDASEFPLELSLASWEVKGEEFFCSIIHDITERKRVEETTQRHLRELTALSEIDRAITSTLDLRTVLDVLLDKIDLVLPYSATTIRLLNKESGLLEPVACRNLDEEEWKTERWRGGRGIPNVAFETKALVTISNVQTDPQNRDQAFFRKHGLVSYLGVPLIAKGEILGVISFYTKKEHEFSNEEVEFLTTLAEQAAIAIHNSQLYEGMASLAAQLSRSNKVKDDFLSVMSHELRTPLNVVVGYTGMIKDGLLGEINLEQEKALEKVIGRARDQLTMISGILQATQLEAKRVKVESQEVSLGQFLNDLRSNYEVPLGKEITLKWDYSSDLPVMKADSEKLKHILQNLINNAIKFTEKGHVIISARIRHEATGNRKARGNRQESLALLPPSDPHASGRWVEFKVADTGVGIPEEALPIIFEKFHQVDSSETRLYGGVGIGLYIVKKFTGLLGGKVEVESEPGKGSTFTVIIPLEQ